MFLVFTADLKTFGKDNSLIKFADDCTLLVRPTDVSDVNFETEMISIK